MLRRFLRYAAVFALLRAVSAFADDTKPLDLSLLPPAAQATVDFVKDIRPILEKNCYSCHGPDKQKSNFRLDVKLAAFKGGEHGKDILPGRSAESPLIHYVGGLVEDMVMPPKGERLTTAQIALLRAWIDQGSAWPDGIDREAAKPKEDFWTFKTPSRPKVPAPHQTGWARNPIDDFILARLEAEKLSPSPEADRRTLIRRLSFDLIGLPPMEKEVQDFIADTSTDAYEHLVDRLLASSRYGERWGRHWLDVVHYGESHGYDKDKPRLNAWPYRDYVIQSFNDDKAYSRFVTEQLAGDILYPDDPQGVVATGFIAAGPWDFVGHVELPETKTDGLIARYNDRDDMVMTTMSTFLSLTVHCARCHDHKFDPIAQKEYYNLQSVFAGVDRADRIFDSDPEVFVRRKALLERKKTLQAELKPIEQELAQLKGPEIDQLNNKLSELKRKLKTLPEKAETSPSNGYHSEVSKSPDATKWVQVDLGHSMPLEKVRLIPARPKDFADTPGFGFPTRFRVEVSEAADFATATTLLDQTGDDAPNPGDNPVEVDAHGSQGRFVRMTATRLWERTADYVLALGELQAVSHGTNAALFSTVTALDSIEQGLWSKEYLVDGYDSRKLLDPSIAPRIAALRGTIGDEVKGLETERQAKLEELLPEASRTEWKEAHNQIDVVQKQLESLPKPQTVYAAASDFPPQGSFKPAPGVRPVHYLKRGDVKSPGDLAQPGALACLPGLQNEFKLPDANDGGSRRAALARWVTDANNLLMRRSIVNRVWQYHFGHGIVDSPNDFGHMGSAPTHPELLDWLAYWFMDHGESLKKLHRLIVTSAAYRQVSSDREDYARLDADNRYLWRMNRQRLDAESLRDALLQISGKLDLKMGGPSVQQFYFKDDHSPIYDYTRYDVNDPGAYRRSVYRFIVRSVPDPFMECMDGADPSILTPRRNTTLTALQALSTLNDPFVLNQCEHLARRLEAISPNLGAQIAAAYRLALLRSPSQAEQDRLAAYAGKYGLVNACRILLNSNEFMFVD